MKVLHIVAGDISGGAARGAYWLHEGLIESDVNSKILIQDSSDVRDLNVIPAASNGVKKLLSRVRNQADQIPVRMYRNRAKNIFSPAIIGYDFTKLKFYKEADIIHLHWINHGFVNMKILSEVDKPVIWTLRDMWPFTGGCHYTGDCNEYKKSCGSCPHLSSRLQLDLSRYVLRRKEKYLKNRIYPVAISNWLKECAEQSTVFKGKKIEMIPNCINTEVFQPTAREEARERLEIKTDRPVVLFGALSPTSDKRKGFKEFIEAIRKLGNKDYFFLIFGSNYSKEISDLEVSCKFLGHLNDDKMLALAYSAADVFVAPSIQEAFGKTLVESLACGTPVVAFNATGPKDIIIHKECGYLSEAFNSDDLAEGINWILEDDDRLAILSHNARERAVREYSLSTVSEKYIKLYQEVLN